jgi:pimeloyl-ACP methyl ester carboxylesterase
VEGVRERAKLGDTVQLFVIRVALAEEPLKQFGIRAERCSTSAGTQTPGQVDFVSRYEVLSEPSVVARGGLAMFHWDASETLRRIAVPVLLITADRDTTTLPAASEYMQRTLPRAELTVVGPGKHMGALERNREYDGAVRAFAQRCFDDTSASAAVH